MILRPGNRDRLREQGGCVVWLTAPGPILRRRLAADPTTASRRPGLTGADPLAEIDAALSTREPLYRECAGMVIDTSSDSPERIVAAILRRLETPSASRCPPEVAD